MNDEVKKGTEAPTRDQMRATLLATHKADVETITLHGIDLELRRPTVSEFMGIFDEDAAKGESFAKILIQCAYIPGTNEKVFEPTDLDVLVKWPFDKEAGKVMKFLNLVADVGVGDGEKELKKHPSS